MMTCHNSRPSGFTLIEVMVAVAIMALVATAAISTYSTAIDGIRSVEEASAELTEINAFFSILERDLTHAVNRGIIGGYGVSEPAFAGGSAQDYPLVMTKTGWPNLHGAPRSYMQRLRYRVEDEVLYREHWQMLDLASDEEPVSLDVLSGVIDLQVRFLTPPPGTSAVGGGTSPAGGNSPNGGGTSSRGTSQGGTWVDQWPPRNQQTPLPAAIELTLELESWGVIKRLFPVGGL